MAQPKKQGFVLDCCSVNSKQPEYQSLQDNNLAPYFSSNRKRKFLSQQGLINRRGEIQIKTEKNAFTVQNEVKPYGMSPRANKKMERKKSPRKTKKVKAVTAEELKGVFAAYHPTTKQTIKVNTKAKARQPSITQEESKVEQAAETAKVEQTAETAENDTQEETKQETQENAQFH